jgi:phosphoribosylformimino-5-aminoimidazole carboxamide ribotide isomerase
MILFPAIDLKDGKCVRLVKGDMANATVYSENPGEQARAFMEIGFPWLHVVDLDGAVAGKAKNEPALDAILSSVAKKMRVQVGGGIRDRVTIDSWLEKGVSRVILGTAALRDPDLVRDAARENPGKIAVGIDARGGKVAVEGWTETSDMTALELARLFEDVGVAAIIYTDIDRDGVLAGVNWEATIALAEKVSIPIIASGGLASMADIERLLQPDAAKLEGAISGRALYDGRIDPKAALALLARGGSAAA